MHRSDKQVLRKNMAIQFGFMADIPLSISGYEAKRTSGENVTTHQNQKVISLSLTAYTNRSLNNLPPGVTEYLDKSVIPSLANTSSSIKVFPVHSVEGFDKIK